MVVHLNPPSKCDLCRDPLLKVFYDAKTLGGSWGNICISCFHMYGVGLGTGRGQRYHFFENKWRKVDG